MKIFREVLVIFGLYYVGELISTTLYEEKAMQRALMQFTYPSLPLPGSLVGMILLFALLQLHIVELEQIATVSDFLLGHLPFFFLPAGVALMASFSAMKGLWIWMLVICLVTTIITMGCSGRIIQHMMERKSKP